MNCIIIDDELTSRIILNQHCSGVSDLDVIEEFSNAIQAMKFLNANEIDLIFLDIHMPDFSGFDFIQTLKNPPKVILTTSDKGLALDAFEYDCIVDYLVKPILFPRFEKAVEKARSFSQRDNSKAEANNSGSKSTVTTNEFYVNIDRTLIKIDTDTVNVIEAKGDYIFIKTTAKEYKVHTTLKKIVDKLPPNVFLQVHRSYIINLSRIVDIEDNSILIDKDVIPISRSKRPELMRRLNLV
ncbi:LytTR family DNA-binding domain-containing protein [Reichenbachiella sp. MALMAid0571]|uniref:LytR/AlgR family response regulator transcription factor n=1 Tax=Reichenbachiella sp. MALMAid0571 TaxID=3143939 RepID=UPI0032DFBE81